MVKLSRSKRRHLASVYATAAHYLVQMDEAAREGRSPTGVGAPLAPLPPHEAETILAPVREAVTRLRQLALEYAPTELAELERPQSLGNTLVWLSNLLGRIRVAVDDLLPRALARYGKCAPEEAAVLEDAHRVMFTLIQTARERLDNTTTADGGSVSNR
ncbi:MAG: hypothetical protein HPY44_19895 [Armatimonadetes bacterium]|nr:hypothetical protein [Armatimonadota bacterium]